MEIREALSFFPENKLQRHTSKAKSFTDLIGQVSLVRKMDAVGVDDKNES
jgi:hypothetical protein